MERTRFKKAGNYALIILGVGAGQLLSNAYFGKAEEQIALSALSFVVVSLVVLATSYIFLGWWSIKRQHLGSAEPLPIVLSPVVWLPALAALVYLAMSLFNA